MRGHPAPNPLHDSWVGGGGRPAGRRCLQPATGEPRGRRASGSTRVLAPRRYVLVWKALTASPLSPARWVASRVSAGTRFTVEHLLSLVGAGWTLEQIQADFPFIEAADIQQSSAYAAFSVREYHLPVTRPA